MLLTRRLLAAVLLAGSGVVTAGVGGASALPCPGGGATFQDQTMDADDVFTGTVTERQAQGKQVVYSVAVERVYKGDVDTADVSVVTDRPSRRCGLPRLDRESAYMFFTRGADLTTSRSTGTTRATGARVSKVERLLGDGRSPVPPAPAEATFTVVASEPTSFERVAAPGLALVIVGVLGLLLAVGLGRRRA